VSRAVLQSDLGRLARSLEPRAQEIVEKTAHDVEAAAKIHASGRPGPNVITGHLRASIHTEPPGRLEQEVRVSAFYGIYLEMGTRNMPPYPFLGPGAENVRPGFHRAVAALFHR
jgi:HK97 gp10 family phage protein